MLFLILMQICKTYITNFKINAMNSNQENNQFGQGSKIDERHEQNSERHSGTQKNSRKHTSIDPKKIDDDFLSGDNEAKFHPNLDKYEISIEDEDRYNYGTSEHDDSITIGSPEEDSKPRYSSPSRNGSHRNH